MSVTVYTRQAGGFMATEGTPDGPDQYVMVDVKSRELRMTNIARTVGSLTFKGHTYPIVEYTP